MQIIRKNILLSGILLLGIAFTTFSIFSFGKAETWQEIVEVEALEIPAPFEVYGIVADSFNIIDAKIRSGQSLSDILYQYKVGYPIIDKLVKASKDIFDVRSMAAGKKYLILAEGDEGNKARYFIYEQSAIEAIVFDIADDSVRVYKVEKEVRLVQKEIEGEISSSLYTTLQQAGAPAALAVYLADIYAWSIDFYRLQKGDKFKVIYDEKWADDALVGTGRIHAAVFTHYKEDYFAFYYHDGDFSDYYDLQGKGLRKAFLQAPLKFGRLSSAYTTRRFHPVQKRWKAHLGTDYAAPAGTPILAVGDGVISEATYKKFNGNYVKIKHNGTYETQYLHMSKIKQGMRPGTRVRQGDVIGYVGSTGLATGPHVCFRFWKNGKQVDHRKEKLPSAKPIKPEVMEDYLEIIAPLKAQLDGIGTIPKTEDLVL